MPDLNQPLTKLTEEYAEYDKKLGRCLEHLGINLNEAYGEEILRKARSDFMSMINFNRYQSWPFSTEEALEHALFLMTNNHEKARKAMSACSLFRIALRRCLFGCQHKMAKMTKKSA